MAVSEPEPAFIAPENLGVVLTGGGARGAYQVGVLSYIAQKYPRLSVPIVTGVSAGAVNAAHIAAHPGTFAQAMTELRHLWCELTTDNVFRADAGSMLWSAIRTGMRLFSGGFLPAPKLQGLLNTKPLRDHLEESYAAINGELTGIEANLKRGKLKAIAIVTTSYSTGQSVVWVQGSNVHLWTRPQRISVHTRITLDHVMASAALPVFFPAVRIADQWYGDGGIRLAAPLSPALHLGANRILAVSTRMPRTQQEASQPMITQYPPPAQILGTVFNAVFLDLIDQDALRLNRLNRLLDKLPLNERDGLKPVRLLVIRPSLDLGRLAAAYESKLPPAFKFMVRGLGTRETSSPDMLSMLLFEKNYLTRLIEIGEADAEARADEIEEFLFGAD